MTFTQSIKSVFQKYAQFSGRASRAELWYFIGFILIIMAVFIALFWLMGDPKWLPDFMLKIIKGTHSWPIFEGPIFIWIGAFVIFFLIILTPTLAVMTRRFHDAGWSGWWIVLVVFGRVASLFLPYPVNIITLFGFGTFFIVISLFPSQNGANRYGPMPES